MTEPQRPVQTVTGPVDAAALGVVLPHEHLFNDLSGCLVDPSFPFSSVLTDRTIEPSLQWALRQDPYCSADNVAPKDLSGVRGEALAFQGVGGGTIVDATGSAAIGRSPAHLVRLSRETGLHVVMSTGAYLEKFEGSRLTSHSVEELAEQILRELRDGVGAEGEDDVVVRAGMIGEVGVSPDFTPGERTSLRAAALAQHESPGTAMNIHMPGWLRRGDEVLDIAVGEMGADPAQISLAHSDPSGADLDYQRRLLDRGVWLEFDMIGLDISFPGEGVSPSITDTADAVARLIDLGYGDQILLSHDLFLKQMWSSLGGGGFLLVPTVFLELLVARGVDRARAQQLITTNPQRYLGGAHS
ncbi:phosphotriesterase-related protein [Brachybacterium ginsengisoli]|uniref:Phosphotriesterase-related protein n=1 Tax=Brachybacterium ginsengisoli TaxID=1331682 RepID=A0A291H0H6_9MICO|nr:phosphotriesterase [Brachybacterium ginsengisoli]ATG55892.1 phosphotriesterase-related protein [Brachybacterium ginsengisoli]